MFTGAIGCQIMPKYQPAQTFKRHHWKRVHSRHQDDFSPQRRPLAGVCLVGEVRCGKIHRARSQGVYSRPISASHSRGLMRWRAIVDIAGVLMATRCQIFVTADYSPDPILGVVGRITKLLKMSLILFCFAGSSGSVFSFVLSRIKPHLVVAQVLQKASPRAVCNAF